ncbi:hypothetical protein [Spirosoma validum]|uniref:RHS repeat protein n=1 Tax=Spirosoma validum TaxID=2771355 RepID=A0A927B2W2_9BACT|nr:hypothetical protein [Spirosoma validum]MBD2754408.1 hypothetical protein [Spirosoma validum]
MKTCLLFLFLIVWTACQSNEPDSFSIEPQLSTYSDEAPVTQKMFCNSVNCENPINQEIYTYHPDGRLSRIDQFGRMTTGKLEMVSYTDYRYTSTGQLSGKIRYGKYGTDSKWVTYDESEYVYTNGVLSQERTYFNQHSPEQRILTGQVIYDFKDGQKTGQTWYDAQYNLSRRVVYTYQRTTLVKETWYSATDTVMRRFEHRFAGNIRQISEYIPNSAEQISMVEKTYDAQGRLTREETKVINPLLCLMQAGVIRYVY